MKKTLSILCLAMVVFGFLLILRKQQTTSTISYSTTPSPTRVKQQVIENQANTWLFVPYWSFSNRPIQDSNYDNLIYFGITASREGIDKNEDGYKKIKTFFNLSDKNKKKFLLVRMVDSSVNSIILEDLNLQDNITKQSVAIAKENNFNGIVLDFEISSLSFQSVIDKISKFYSQFSKETKNNNLEFSVTLYGDTLYRLRPYDVTAIEKYSDNIFILAYDFHKARENPGPNFPLNGVDQYGYDFVKMVGDYSEVIPKEKLTIVFGMFGYDWTIDEKGESEGLAESLSLNQIQQRFIFSCRLNNCFSQRDEKSTETKVTYTDKDDKKHIVWFEDLESAAKKKEFLNQKGIVSTAFWAYSFY